MANLEAELARFESELAQFGQETQQVDSVAAGTAAGAINGGVGPPLGRLPPPKARPPPSQVGMPELHQPMQPPAPAYRGTLEAPAGPSGHRPPPMGPSPIPPPRPLQQEMARPMHPPPPQPQSFASIRPNPSGMSPSMMPPPPPELVRPRMAPGPGPGSRMMPQPPGPGTEPSGHRNGIQCGPMMMAPSTRGPGQGGPGGPPMQHMGGPGYSYGNEGYFPGQHGMAGSGYGSAANAPAVLPNPTIAAPAQAASNPEETAKTSKEALAAENQEKKKKALPRMAAGERWLDPTLSEWPENDYRIFVGDLGNEVNDDILAKAFSKYTSFQRAKVIRDKRTNKTKGYGFVSFLDANDFAKALKEMQQKYIGNRPCKLRKSTWAERADPNPRRNYKRKAGGKANAAKKQKGGGHK